MPTGNEGLSAARAVSMERVSATVSASGCFCTPRMTAGLPLKPASPRLMAGAKLTLATWLSKMDCPFTQATGNCCRSSSRVVRPRLRIRYSRAFSSRKPPLLLLACPCKASRNCSTLTPSCPMRAVSGCTWYWRTSPPIGITCATPGMARRRGRSTKSAYSRVAMALILASSMGMATSMTSPMMELIGPMAACCTPAGSASRAVVKRSLTICRAR